MGESCTYSEKLSCDGTLAVTTKGFRIRYYFPGPEARSRGTFVDVDGARIEEYIQAYEANWNTYRQLKASIPSGGEFQQEGQLGMQIRIGRFNEGVCIQAYHMPLKTEDEVQANIASSRYAMERAAKAITMPREL